MDAIGHLSGTQTYEKLKKQLGTVPLKEKMIIMGLSKRQITGAKKLFEKFYL